MLKSSCFRTDTYIKYIYFFNFCKNGLREKENINYSVLYQELSIVVTQIK